MDGYGQPMNFNDLFAAQNLGLQPNTAMPQTQPMGGPQNVQMPPEVQHLNDVIAQYTQSKQEDSQPNYIQQILSKRFQPDMADASRSVFENAISAPTQYISPEQVAQQRATMELTPYSQALELGGKQAEIGLKNAQAGFFNLGGQAANKPEPVFDPMLNSGKGGFRFASPIETRINQSLQPASTVPAAAHQFGTGPTGNPITQASSEMDKKALEGLTSQTMAMMKGGDPSLAVNNLIQLLDKYPHMNTASGGLSAANQYIPGFNLPEATGTIPPEDYKQILANVGELKGVAMSNRTNIRNLREFNAITAPADIFGGDQNSAKAQAYALGASALQSKAYTQFKNAYYDQYNTLQGSDELWQSYISTHEPVLRDANKNVVGINQKSISPAGWMPLIQNAPQILQQIRGAQTQQPVTNQPQVSGGGKVINFSDLPE